MSLQRDPRLPALKLVAALALAVGLTGCAVDLSAPRREALDSLVGKTPQELTAQLGRPTRVIQSGDTQLFAYDDHGVQWVPSDADTTYDESEHPIEPFARHVRCTTTFQVGHGAVRAWKLDGSDCRQPAYPPLGSAIEQALNRNAARAPDDTATSQHDPDTGNSVVDKGQFQYN